MNETTLPPVLVPLAPAAKLAKRVPNQVGRVLKALGAPIDFVLRETAAMGEASYAKTASRSIVGSMNELSFLDEVHRAHGEAGDLVELSVRLAGTSCRALYSSHSMPVRELAALIAHRFDGASE